jgi:hypothetical protein
MNIPAIRDIIAIASAVIRLSQINIDGSVIRGEEIIDLNGGT